MGLSISRTGSRRVGISAKGFRPLSGKWGYRSNGKADSIHRRQWRSFRPLSGKWGYRSHYNDANYSAHATAGFRPLSGKWGYRSSAKIIILSMMNNTIVSVPSRGNGVIDVLRKTANEPWTVEVGFRPLSGKWGYRFREETTMNITKIGFRPLSGKWGYR